MGGIRCINGRFWNEGLQFGSGDRLGGAIIKLNEIVRRGVWVLLGFITHTKRHKSQESQERSPDLERVGATQLVVFSISPCFHLIVHRMMNRIV